MIKIKKLLIIFLISIIGTGDVKASKETGMIPDTTHTMTTNKNIIHHH